MSGRSGRDRVIGRRLLPIAALAVLVFAGLALLWGGLAPALAQDQTRWWGGSARVDLANCPDAKRDTFVQEVQQDNPRLLSAESGCLVRLGGTGSEDRSLKAVGSLDYAARAEGNRIWLRLTANKICQAAGQAPGCSGNVYQQGWNKLSCADATAIAGDVLQAIGAPFGASDISCSYHEAAYYTDRQTSAQYIDIIFRSGPPRKPQQSCDKAAFLGAWKNDHAKYARYGGAGLTFEKSVIRDEIMGRFSLRKEDHNTQFILGNVISTVGPPKGCLFVANLNSSMQQRDGLKYDKATDSFTIVMADGSPNASFPGRWTRGAPAKAAATCGKGDINGTWHRADGARILMTGVGVFGGGGHAVMERYPEDRWPKGELKFRGVKEVSQCRYEASCTTINRRTTNGVASYGVTQSACTLTLDPQKRTLSATGGSGLFTRVAPASGPSASEAKAEAEAAKKREADAEAARTAALNRAIAERDAEIQRRNAAAKAADERRQAEYRAAVARQQAEAERIRREDAAAKARYEQEMAAWRARVEACKAGNTAQCQ